MSLTVIQWPGAEPIHLDEAKAHLRITDANSDAKITSLIPTARELAEQYTGRALVSRQWDWTLDSFPVQLLPPFPPLRAVDSVKYTDAAGAQQTLATTEYTVDKASEPSRLVEAYGKYWPTLRGTINDVVVRYRAGYATPFTVVAATDVITAIGHPYADADPVTLTNSGGALPAGLSVQTTYYARDVSGNTLKLAATAGGAAIDITGTGTGAHFLGQIPRPILDAMLLIIGELNERREDNIVGAPIQQVPLSAEYLLDYYRVHYRVPNV